MSTHDTQAEPHPLLYMIGNAHIDPVWLWRWPEGCAEAIGTCWAAVELLEEEEGVIFTRGEAALYRWIEEYDPPLFARIQELVRRGSWAIVNGWWIQPDCNLPHGEAFIRQALLGKRFFQDRFEVDVSVGYNVDSFGHAATLPMLLRHTGFDSYVFMRPQEHEMALPGALFDWLSPDRSRVTVFRIQVAYTTVHQALQERIEHDAALARGQGYPFMCFYGAGNHGGGPTRADLAVVRAARAAGYPVAFSDPTRYFMATAGVERPEVDGELQYHAIGCYAAVSALKALNRRAEARLAQAETACALAMLQTGAAYPHTRLGDLWETLLFNQFHDILAGTSIPSATRDALEALGGVVQGADAVLNGAIRRLAATIAPAPDRTDAAFLVFNLTGAPQRLPIEYEPWLTWQSKEPRRLLDHAGTEVAFQDLPAECYANGVRRILFAPEVPACGYTLFRFARGAATDMSGGTLDAKDMTLENARWRLEIDPLSGGIAQIVDRETERNLLSGIGHLPIAVDDLTDTWSHGVDRFGFTGHSPIRERIDIVERGPIRASMRVRCRAEGFSMTSTYLLHEDPIQPIEIRVEIDWREQRKLLRLCYPLALSAPSFRYEIPYGSIERPANGREWPGQRWVLVGEPTTDYAIALANDGKYSYAAERSTLYITALRSPALAHHDPYQLAPGGDYVFADQGRQSFTIRLLAGSRIGAPDAYRLAEELLRPPVVTPHVARGGDQPWRGELFAIGARSTALTWLKGAEDGDEVIARLLELEGRVDSVNLPGDPNGLSIQPYAILSVRGRADRGWALCDGLERPLSEEIPRD
jgi:alpha-mannosidase